MTDPIILVGGGGHCKSCIDVVEAAGKKITGILDKNTGQQIAGITVVGADDQVQQYVGENSFLITVGQVKDAAVRMKLYNMLKGAGARLATVLSPHAVLAKGVQIGEGTIVMHHALVNTEVTIGVNCIINNKALVEHETIVGDHCHISTAAVINGNCRIGNRVFIGSNSVVAQTITIGDDVVIGAGSVVISDILQPGIYAGNPAIKIK